MTCLAHNTALGVASTSIGLVVATATLVHVRPMESRLVIFSFVSYIVQRRQEEMAAINDTVTARIYANATLHCTTLHYPPPPPTHTHTHTHTQTHVCRHTNAHTHARTDGRTHARTHAHIHTHTHTHTHTNNQKSNQPMP